MPRRASCCATVVGWRAFLSWMGSVVNDTWSELAAGFMQGVAGVAAALLVLALAPKGGGTWRTLLVVGAIVIGGAVTALLHLLLVSLSR
jgi:hypothetical protein